MGDCNGCEGDTWLVDTLNWCQSLQGRALDREPGKVSLKLLDFLLSLLSPSLPSPFSLTLHLLHHFQFPFSPFRTLCGKDPEPFLALGAGCSHLYSPWVPSGVHTGAGPLQHPSGQLPLLPHDIPRWPLDSAECKYFLMEWDCSQERVEGLVISGANLVYAPCSLLG